jgi:hypothetical protein
MRRKPAVVGGVERQTVENGETPTVSLVEEGEQ